VGESDAANLLDLLGPWWLLAAVAVCLPVSVAVLARVGRWWITADPVPKPIDGEAPPVPWPEAFGVGLFVGMQALLVLTTMAYNAAADAGYLPWEPLPIPPEFSPGLFLAQVVPPIIGLALLVRFPGGAAAAGLRAAGLRGGLGLGAVTFAAILPVCVAALVVSVSAMQLVSAPITSHPLLEMLQNRPAPGILAAAAVQATVLAPLAEEFIYRGVLMTTLLRPFGVIGALLASSAVFGLIHLPTEPQAVLPLFILGLALGYAAYRTRSLVAPIVAHALFNALMIFGTSLGAK
jgi:membrane protease YdiL (CAAX protease family)